MACFAEPRPQELKGLAPQIRACLNAERVHLGCRLRAHAMKLRDRKRSHEGLGFVGHDRELAVRLALIGRELREELFKETPAEAVSLVSAKMRARISLAVSHAVAMPLRLSVTSR